MSTFLRVKLIESNMSQVRQLSSQESYLHQVVHLMKGSSSDIVSTFLRFGAVNKNLKVDANYAENRCFSTLLFLCFYICIELSGIYCCTLGGVFLLVFILKKHGLVFRIRRMKVYVAYGDPFVLSGNCCLLTLLYCICLFLCYAVLNLQRNLHLLA